MKETLQPNGPSIDAVSKNRRSGDATFCWPKLLPWLAPPSRVWSVRPTHSSNPGRLALRLSCCNKGNHCVDRRLEIYHSAAQRQCTPCPDFKAALSPSFAIQVPACCPTANRPQPFERAGMYPGGRRQERHPPGKTFGNNLGTEPDGAELRARQSENRAIQARIALRLGATPPTSTC
jgi:hypothetical protein